MSNIKETDYEEQVRKEFEQTQPDSNETKVTTEDLGKVNVGRKVQNQRDEILNDPDIKRINDMFGYYNIPLETLPSQGRYYPEGTRISIRAARVEEIHEFSSIDETDAKDVLDKMTYIIQQCTRIYVNNTPMSYRDIINADRLVLIFKIRELTFKDGLKGIKIPVPDDACSTIGCRPQKEVELVSNKLTFLKPSEELEKYYDSVNKCYNIATKSFGTITLYIPTIGVSSAVENWMRKKWDEKTKFTETLAEMVQFVTKDWRGLDDKGIFNKIVELEGWSPEKFSLVFRLIEKLNVGIELFITDKCASCGGEIKVPIKFPGGYRSLFVPTISDLGDELL